jgi:pimeloyl-ACP methyl ester carboxylesterase
MVLERMTRAGDGAVTSILETPRYFDGPEGALFGILTQPSGAALGTTAIVAGGGWFGTSMGRNQLLVRLCRRAASQGYHAFRFDYRGVGESEGSITRFEVDRWFPDDLEAACREMARAGCARSVLIGWCFGARSALAALDAAPQLRGAILVSPPIRRAGTVRWGAIEETIDLSLWRLARNGLRNGLLAELLRRDYRRSVSKAIRKRLRAASMRRRARGRQRVGEGWVSPGFLGPLERLVERRVPVLLIYGTADGEYRDFRRALPGRVGRVLERGKGTVSVVVLEGEVSAAGSLAMQSATLDLIDAWLRDLAASGTGPNEKRVP